MLNNRQRQFRQRMKEAERSKSIHNPVYSYRDQRFESEKPKKRYKRPLLQIGGLVSLLVLLWNLYAFSSYLFPWSGNNTLFSANQLEIHQYIQESSEIELAVNSQIGSLIKHYNENSLTNFHIEEAQEQLFNLQKQIDTTDNRFLAMKAYLDEQFSLAYQVTNVLKTENSAVKHQELELIIKNQQTLIKRKNPVLIQLLESEKISYEENVDGTISYQYEI